MELLSRLSRSQCMLAQEPERGTGVGRICAGTVFGALTVGLLVLCVVAGGGLLGHPPRLRVGSADLSRPPVR